MRKRILVGGVSSLAAVLLVTGSPAMAAVNSSPTPTPTVTPTVSPAITDTLVTPNIVGGTQATIADAPWQVGLISANSTDEWNGQFCGGSIIAAQWVATAAHCVVSGSTVSSPASIRILAGQATLSTTTNNRAVAVSNIYVHPQYASSADHDDIALIKLTSPLTLVPGSVQKIDIPSASPTVGSTDLITGWGDQASGASNYPTVMRKAQLQVFADSICATAYGAGFSNAKMVCAANSSYTIDTCQGDSGGPMARNTGSAWVLDGITSFGQGCATYGYPGVYTEVFNYSSWIASTMATTPVAGTFTTVPVPTITGTKKAGKTLTANEGGWSPTPTSYTYRWLSSATKNGNYSAISGATSKTYLLKTTDRTRFIKVEVTAVKSGYTSTKSTSARTVAIG
jgi:secreted trypsin-like serine protease